MEGPAAVQVRTLVVIVTAALNTGTDPHAAVQAVSARPAPSPTAVAAVVRLVRAVHTPGMPAEVVLARIEGAAGHST